MLMVLPVTQTVSLRDVRKMEGNTHGSCKNVAVHKHTHSFVTPGFVDEPRGCGRAASTME